MERGLGSPTSTSSPSIRAPERKAHNDVDLGITNLATLASIFTSRGAQWFVGNGHLRDQNQIAALRLYFPDAIVIRLSADTETLRSHILKRAGGNEARLTGDDLASPTSAHQEAVLGQALLDQKHMEGAGIGDIIVDVSHSQPHEIIEQIAQSTTM